MKIIAVLDSAVSAGGGFNQALNAVVQMQRMCRNRFEYGVLTTQLENVEYLEKLGISAEHFSFSIVDRLFYKFRLSTWWQIVQSRFKVVAPFEQKLMSLDCDLVYFVTPYENSASLGRLNYISTVWDLCHRDTPEFPEVREFNLFHGRECHLRNYLASAFTVVVDSEHSADSILQRYGVDRTRLQPMPFSVAPFLETDRCVATDVTLEKYGLSKGYFFYPAQFWAHKNHVRILEALQRLRSDGHKYQVVFSGGDQGNLSYLEAFVRHHHLDEYVRFLGFVPAEDMRGLYEGCRAVIMSSYFGPTNVPPLEAWMVGRPLICSNCCSDQVADAAILFDPDNADELAVAMKKCDDKKLCDGLVSKGYIRIKEIESQREKCESEFLARLVAFSSKLRCWRDCCISEA